MQGAQSSFPGGSQIFSCRFFSLSDVKITDAVCCPPASAHPSFSYWHVAHLTMPLHTPFPLSAALNFCLCIFIRYVDKYQ